MSAGTTTRAAISGSPWPGSRLIRAEVLKLTRRRGLMTAAAVLTIGVVAAFLILRVIVHATSPDSYGPAGGEQSLSDLVMILSVLGALAAIAIGASCGSSDLTAGVFRQLVSTGRSRTALFLARLPAGLGVALGLVAVAYALAAACAAALAGSLPQAGTSLMISAGAWLLLVATVNFLLGLGLSAITGSQPVALAVMLAVTVVVTPLATRAHSLPAVRQALPGVALLQVEPAVLGQVATLTEKNSTVALVLVVWAVIALAAGIWRTAARDA